MHLTKLGRMLVVPVGLWVLLLLSTHSGGTQSPGVSSAGQQKQPEERDRLSKQVEELRRAGRFDEAVAVAERALELERGTGEAMRGQVAEALARLAELNELRGDWGRALARRKEALAARERVDGKDHWRTADARLMLAFAEKGAGLGQADRAKVAGALRKEQEAAQLEEQGKNVEAERVALEALETYRAVVGRESAEVARAWHRIGRCRWARHDAGGAKEANERAVAIRRKALPGSHPDLGRSLNNQGAAERSLGNSLGARELFGEAVQVWRASLESSSPLTAMGLTNLGDVQRELREYAAAKQCYQEALAIRRKSLPPDHPDTAQSLNKLGNVQYELREHVVAKASYEEALAIRRRALPKDHPDIANSLTSLGKLQLDLRDFAAAKLSFEEALAIRRKALPKDHPGIAASLNNLGVVQEDLRDYAAAKASYKQALAILRKVLPENHPDIASNLHNLGELQSKLREYVAARASHEEALAIRRKALPPGDPAIADSFYGLGQVQRDLMEYAAARASYEQALEIYRKALPSGHPYIADTMHDLGHLLWELGERASAKKMIEGALTIRRKSLPKDHPDIAISLNDLGLIQSELYQYQAARTSLEESLDISRKALPPGHPDIAISLYNLGNLKRELREYAGARTSHEQALAIRRKALPPGHRRIAFSLFSLAWVDLAAGTDVRDAVSRAAEATDILRADQLRLAVAQAEPEQLATTVPAKLCVHFLVDATLAAGMDPSPTYDRVVSVKGSVTAQQRWARQARDAADPETVRLLDQLRQVTRQIVGRSVGELPSDRSLDPQKDLASLRILFDERARLERRLTESSAAYRAVQARAAVGGREIRAALPEGTALIDLVEYSHIAAPAREHDEESWEQRQVAFVVRPEQPGVIMVPLGPSKVLAGLIDRWRASYGAGKAPPAGETDPGVELRKRLWEPLAAHLEGVKVVLVSPDGPLHGLPWAALPGSHPGTFLVHEYAFAVVPVPQLLPELLGGKPRLANQQPSLLLAGGIAFGEQNARDAEAPAGKLPPVPVFGPLAGTESEVNDLKAQFEDAFPDAPAPRRLIKDKATKQAVLAALPSHRFVHLATHGFFAAESETPAVDLAQRAEFLLGGMRLSEEAVGRHPGLLSGVVFAGVNLPERKPEETILTALEAAEQDLGQVELVVLSACNTGRGQVADGEGVLGLQRAFQLAGARSVVASLWRVPDEETHQLMREFYRRVWSDKPVPRAEALRQAQLWMLENWKPRGGLERPAPQGPPPPYVWAAFVLSGDWR